MFIPLLIRNKSNEVNDYISTKEKNQKTNKQNKK